MRRHEGLLLLQPNLVDPLWQNLQGHAYLRRVPKRVGIRIEALLGQLVYEPVGTFGGDLHHPSAHHDQAPSIVRVYHVDGYAWIAADVDDLLPALGGVDQDVLAVGVDPHLGYLRGAICHEGGELAVGRFSQQLP